MEHVTKEEIKTMVESIGELVNSAKDEWAMRQSLMLTEQCLRDITGKRSVKGDRLVVSDYVVAYYGTPDTPPEKRVIIFASKGHIVGQALSGLRGRISSILNNASGSACYGISQNWAGKTTYMRVGTGAGATTNGTTNLTAIDNTSPDAQSISTSDPSGTYRVAWTATWNAGTLTAITVSEIGLWLNINAAPNGSTIGMFSRLSNADGDFTSFVVNIAVPLTIEWRLTLSFA